MRANGAGVRASLAFILLATLGACGEETLLPPIQGWLHCDECIDGERAAVRALGESAVPQLKRALLEGPPARDREVVRQEAVAAHSRAGVGTLTASQYAAHAVDNYVATYHERAALGLGDIGTVSARMALDEALQPPRSSQYRADVLRKIRFARMAIGATPFGGRFERSMVNFGDTAFLLAPPARPFTATDVVTLDDTLPADLILSRQPGRVGFAAVGALGSHMVVVRRVGAPISEIAGFAIVSLADPNDRMMNHCADLACEISASPVIPAGALPHQSFLSLWSPPPRRDSLDLFRFMPSSPLQLTAEVDWSGPANLDLNWRRCSPPTPVGNSDGATAAKPERTSVTIPGGDCWLLFVAQKSVLPEPTFAHLRLTSP
jgi:hypothetical protein